MKRTEENRINYTRQKKLCVDMALEKQKIHYSKIVEDAGSCQKTLFKIANELLDKNEERVLPTHTDAKILANEFNQFYVEKVQKIRNSIPEETTDLRFCAQPFQGQRLEVFRPTSVEELHKIIKENGIKTSVEDPVPAKLIKPSVDILLPEYAKLINKSLAEGSMECVKSSVIERITVQSIISDFSKLIERVVNIRTYEHMTINALHTAEEFGYKKWHNTETMMLGLSDEVMRGFDENQVTIVIFLDLSAAFGNSSHQRRILKTSNIKLNATEKQERGIVPGKSTR